MVPRNLYATADGDISGHNRRHEPSSYPQLERLCADFGLRVSQPLDREQQEPHPQAFGLVDQHPDAKRCLTPFFPSMSQLEMFVASNLVDILHDYFFGEQAEARI